MSNIAYLRGGPRDGEQLVVEDAGPELRFFVPQRIRWDVDDLSTTMPAPKIMTYRRSGWHMQVGFTTFYRYDYEGVS